MDGSNRLRPRVRADPHAAAAIRLDRVDLIAAQAAYVARVVTEVRDRAGLRVDPIEPRRARPDPDRVVGRDVKRSHEVAGERPGAVRVVPEDLEAAGSRVPARHPAAVGRDPQTARSVLVDREDEVGRQPARASLVVLVMVEAIAVVAIQPGLGSEPQEPVAVLVDRPDGALREPFVEREPVEVHRTGQRVGARREQQRQQGHRREVARTGGATRGRRDRNDRKGPPVRGRVRAHFTACNRGGASTSSRRVRAWKYHCWKRSAESGRMIA